jgi:hypothetical protein
LTSKLITDIDVEMTRATNIENMTIYGGIFNDIGGNQVVNRASHI